MPFYAVAKGRHPGVYASWSDCQREVSGFPGASFKKFDNQPDALEFVTPKPVSTTATLDDSSSDTVTIFTDGACKMKKSGRKAGYGIYIPSLDVKIGLPLNETPGYSLTNNRAELTAVIEGIRLLPIGSRVQVVSDSTYCQLIFGGTGKRYASKNYLEKGKPVKNQDLVQDAVELIDQYKITWVHVNSHTNRTDSHSLGNQIADELAVNGCLL